MSGRWLLRAALVPAGIAVVCVLGAGVQAGVDFRHQHDKLEAARQDLASARREADGIRTVLAQTRATIGQLASERDQADASAALTGDTLFQSQGAANAVQGAASAQQTQIGALNSCIGGVRTSLGFLGSGNRASAITTLQNISLICNAAIGATGGARPAFAFDFADPYVLRVGDAYYGYSTNAGAGDIQVAKSSDLRNWVFVGNALAALPKWAAPHATWAPSVLARQTASGTRYIAYYTVQNGRGGPQCISRAVATSPEGQFVDDTQDPMICPRRADAIDPSPFVDTDGAAYLLWRGANGISSQRLAADGLSLEGDEHKLADVDQPWEGKIVEGPSMVRVGGRYYLFYSGNDWGTRSYAVGYAVCPGPTGPCAKPSPAVAFAANGSIGGPGGQEFFADASGQLWMAYHAWTEPNVGYPNSRRLHLMRVGFDPAGAPVLNPSG
jgi:Glycosyl hydrolases family 43